ncbi:D-serine ammonia-lyase [Pusillimonas sp.]|uniref:D-serine ammonia-lyase n=1 Tax=Pusillimonas sp. TaxID=3040095 RepID=UPI0029B4C26A|nr:D-serine ammonia-lyase [Pusillimonas sp.]MDX3895013.1 D-serine ammonia-lyase [Pusillimonas sp.]
MLQKLKQQLPFLWLNPHLQPAHEVLSRLAVGMDEVEEADALLRAWADPLQILFPELAESRGLIESGLLKLEQPGEVLGCEPGGTLWIKQDHLLPLAGSIKARGGIFEVLAYASNILRAQGIQVETLTEAGVLQQARAVLSSHTVMVGSTGNLAFSIGVMASALGLKAIVHMSRDAKPWKKDRLRALGVVVEEHEGDFGAAVLAGRRRATAMPRCHFVDDEDSIQLFLGYAVAALRLKEQLARCGIEVGPGKPLFVYIPCGVGGAPSGITFGLKHIFGDAVHCFFAEPCAAPAMLLRLAYPDSGWSVYDIGLNNRTQADGLAVARASELCAGLVSELVSGIYTVSDDQLFLHLFKLQRQTGIRLEPSAAAGFSGPCRLAKPAGPELRYASWHPDATHLVWTTGGSMVPDVELQAYVERGRGLAAYSAHS